MQYQETYYNGVPLSSILYYTKGGYYGEIINMKNKLQSDRKKGIISDEGLQWIEALKQYIKEEHVTGLPNAV